MKHDKVRFNLHISSSLKASLDSVAKSKRMRTTTLVKNFLQNYVEEEQKRQLEQNLVAGYQFLTKEHQQICKDFACIDAEGWDLWNSKEEM